MVTFSKRPVEETNFKLGNKNFFKFINKINLLKFNETTLVFYTRRYYALNHVTRILMSKLQATLFFRGILFEKFPNVAKEIVFSLFPNSG